MIFRNDGRRNTCWLARQNPGSLDASAPRQLVLAFLAVTIQSAHASAVSATRLSRGYPLVHVAEVLCTLDPEVRLAACQALTRIQDEHPPGEQGE